MTNPDNPVGIDAMEATFSRETEINGERLLVDLAKAIQEKDLDKLRSVAEEIAERVQVNGEPKVSNPICSDRELQDVIDGEVVEIAHVGTGSSGSRIVFWGDRISMPFDESEERRGYGNRERLAFKRLFGIPENEDPSVNLPN